MVNLPTGSATARGQLQARHHTCGSHWQLTYMHSYAGCTPAIFVSTCMNTMRYRKLRLTAAAEMLVPALSLTLLHLACARHYAPVLEWLHNIRILLDASQLTCLQVAYIKRASQRQYAMYKGLKQPAPQDRQLADVLRADQEAL